MLLFEQNFWPVGQVPLQAASCAIHLPLQFCGALGGQLGTHAVPLHETLPPIGAWQAVEHSLRPHVAGSLLLTQTPSQLCQPELQRTLQLPLLQIGVPLGSAGHSLHNEPHAVASSSAAQRFPHG